MHAAFELAEACLAPASGNAVVAGSISAAKLLELCRPVMETRSRHLAGESAKVVFHRGPPEAIVTGIAVTRAAAALKTRFRRETVPTPRRRQQAAVSSSGCELEALGGPSEGLSDAIVRLAAEP
jgi:hypothetical protein